MKNKDKDIELLESAYDDVLGDKHRGMVEGRSKAIDRVQCLCTECRYNGQETTQTGKTNVCNAPSIELSTINTDDYGPVCVCDTFEVG
jgi:hypothetical protein